MGSLSTHTLYWIVQEHINLYLDILYYYCQDIHHNSFGGYWLVYPAWKCSNIHIKTNIFVVTASIQPWLRSSTVTSIRQVWEQDRLLGIAPKGVPKIHAGRLPELRLPGAPQRIGCGHQLTHSVHGDKYWDYCIECISKWARNRWSRDGEKLLAKGFKVYNIVTILLVFKDFFLLYEQGPASTRYSTCTRNFLSNSNSTRTE